MNESSTHGVVLITGAGAGIGRAVAERLGRDGFEVALADVDGERAELAAAAIVRDGGEATSTRLDVRDVEHVRSYVEELDHRSGGIAGLVNNAGVTRMATLDEIEPADFDWMFDVNVRGAFFVMQAVAGKMCARGSGRIVNMASIAAKGYRGVSNVVYAASKGAVISMTRVSSLELAPHNVNVNAICPGPTRTEIFKELVESAGEEAVGRVRGLIPLGRLNETEDIAAMASFLLSGDSRNVTGQCLNVDGGIVYD